MVFLILSVYKYSFDLINGVWDKRIHSDQWNALSLQISCRATITDKHLEKTHMCTSLDIAHIWEAHFLFPSITQSVHEWGLFLRLCYLYSILMGKFKFGITPDCWPGLILDGKLALCSLFLHASKHHTTNFYALLSRESLQRYLKPLRMNDATFFLLFFFLCIHEHKNRKADLVVGLCASGLYLPTGELISSAFLLLPVWTESPSICRWLICSVYRRAQRGWRLMRTAQKGLPMCHPRSLVLKPALPEQQHKCPICVCLPVDTDGWVLALGP